MRVLFSYLFVLIAVPAMADTSTPVSSEALGLARALSFGNVPKEHSKFSAASVAVNEGTVTQKDDGTVIYELTGRAGTIDVNCGPTSLTITGREVLLPFGPGKMMTYSAVFDGSRVLHGAGCP